MVVDASAALAWFLPSQVTPSALALLERRAQTVFIAPWYFGIELRSVLLRSEARGLISASDAEESLRDGLSLIRLEAPEAAHRLDEVAVLARSTGLRFYDALYLALAMDRRLPLASRDVGLLNAATQVGVDALDVRG
ncbi:MAG: type II toxin-antitoxin system VapC family toxin [Alphaproteobacteria bacterium]|nr:type II toxin-antitoxin system VapC family toxin [Alphaproteobacteria bacterium]MBU2378133.1 type II toxin-antitoxin system VapC family toxin [Alphaproteobacteria bacterium]